MLIELYRHGATAGNARGCYIGRTDEPLSDAGRAQLRCADPSLEAVYVTPLLRTQQTAAILFPHARQTVVAGLREMDFGVFEGKNYEDMAPDAAYRSWVASDCTDPIPGGEQRSAFAARVIDAFRPLVDSALEEERTRLVLVVHGGTIMSILDALARPHRGYFEWKTGSGAHWTLRTDERLWEEGALIVVEDAADHVDGGIVRPAGLDGDGRATRPGADEVPENKTGTLSDEEGAR